MFRSVLVPLDGSRFAEAALPLASWLVKDARAALHLVLVHEPVAALLSAGDAVVPNPQVDAELKEREVTYLADTAAMLGEACGGPVQFREVEGAGGPDICEEANQVGADLLVMATHGRGTFRRLWLGSVADYVVRHVSVSILLVHPDRDDEPRSWDATEKRGILVALDFSKEALAILEPVVTLAQLTQSLVTLMHVAPAFDEIGPPVAPYPVPQDPVLRERYRIEAQHELDRVADGLRERGLSVSTRVVPGLSPAGSLLEALEEERYGFVAMTTHGAGGMRRLLLGGQADKVIRGAEKPVLVLRPPPSF
jgi:nucleotide-binding universal stress UspA family protein